MIVAFRTAISRSYTLRSRCALSRRSAGGTIGMCKHVRSMRRSRQEQSNFVLHPAAYIE